MECDCFVASVNVLHRPLPERAATLNTPFGRDEDGLASPSTFVNGVGQTGDLGNIRQNGHAHHPRDCPTIASNATAVMTANTMMSRRSVSVGSLMMLHQMLGPVQLDLGEFFQHTSP